MRFGGKRDGEGGPGALAGACLASALVAIVLAWRGELSLAILCAIALAVLLAAILPRRPRPAAVPSRPEKDTAVASAAIHPDPVILVDGRSLVVEANEAACVLFPSLRERQPLAFTLRDPEILDAVAGVASTGAPQTIEIGRRIPTEPIWEVRLRRLDAPSSSGTGDPAVALFFRDLSDAKRLETMRVDFIANVSHELRTPLASLAGFIDTLKGPARNDEAARVRFLDIMGAQAGRMTRLIDDLLQLSRVELKEHLPPSDRIDLGLTAAHMIEVMTPMARERGVTIALDLPGEPLGVLGDRDELLRLVENLVENAIKYGGSDKPVEVSVRRVNGSGDRETAEFAVRDHGPGISSDHLPRLTERFYRVDVAESRKESGTGLGLAIVKHIVGRHRGRLSIESTPGAGATFRARFPVAPAGEGAMSR